MRKEIKKIPPDENGLTDEYINYIFMENIEQAMEGCRMAKYLNDHDRASAIMKFIANEYIEDNKKKIEPYNGTTDKGLLVYTTYNSSRSKEETARRLNISVSTVNRRLREYERTYQ